MFLHFFFILIYFFLSLFSSEFALSILLSTHAAVMLVERHLVRKLHIDPLTCYGLYSLLAGIANLVLLEDMKTDNLPIGYSYIIPANIPESIGIFFVGNAFIFMGYELFSKRSFPSIAYLIKNPKSHRLLFYVMVLLSLRTLFFHEGILGSLTTILSVFASIGIVFFARLWGKFDDKTYRQYAVVLFVLQTIYAILFSYLRISMIMPTVSLALGYFLGKGSVKVMLSYRAIPLLVALYVFNSYFSFLGENRTTYGEVEGIARL